MNRLNRRSFLPWLLSPLAALMPSRRALAKPVIAERHQFQVKAVGLAGWSLPKVPGYTYRVTFIYADGREVEAS